MPWDSGFTLRFRGYPEELDEQAFMLILFCISDAIMTSGPLDGQFPMLDGPGGLGPPPPPGPQAGTFPRGSKKNQCKSIF